MHRDIEEKVHHSQRALTGREESLCISWGPFPPVICGTQAVRASFHWFAVSDPVALSSAGASVGYMWPYVSRTHTETQPVSSSLIASAWRHLEKLTVYKYSDCRNCQHQPCGLISFGHSLRNRSETQLQHFIYTSSGQASATGEDATYQDI